MLRVLADGGEQIHLTPRETEVLGLLVEGLPHKQIAFRLDISVRTVKAYSERFRDVLNAKSFNEVCLWAASRPQVFEGRPVSAALFRVPIYREMARPRLVAQLA